LSFFGLSCGRHSATVKYILRFSCRRVKRLRDVALPYGIRQGVNKEEAMDGLAEEPVNHLPRTVTQDNKSCGRFGQWKY